MAKKISYILLIEDNTNHAELIMNVFKTLNTENKIILLKDGQEAMDYIQKTNTNVEQDIQIKLVISELNLTKIRGMDVLRFIRESPVCRSVPVVVMSTSSDSKTISEAYKRGADSFITKPVSYKEFIDKLGFVIKKYLDA